MLPADIDTTRIPSQVIEADKKVRQGTTILGDSPEDSATHFVIFQGSVPRWVAPQRHTPFSSEVSALQDIGRQETSELAPIEPSTPDQQVSETRVRLIARKHAGIASSEDFARLDILSARLRALEARENAEATLAITQTIDELEEISTELEQIRSDFDIDE
jgi:hypothetical protein